MGKLSKEMQRKEVNDQTGNVPSSYKSTTSMMIPEETDGRNKRDAINEAADTTSEIAAVAEIQFRRWRGEASRISDKFVLIFHSFLFF